MVMVVGIIAALDSLRCYGFAIFLFGCNYMVAGEMTEDDLKINHASLLARAVSECISRIGLTEKLEPKIHYKFSVDFEMGDDFMALFNPTVSKIEENDD